MSNIRYVVNPGDIYNHWKVIEEVFNRNRRYVKCLCIKCNETISDIALTKLKYKCMKCGTCCHEIIENRGLKRIPLYPEEVDNLIDIAKKKKN